jgi:hypothetical protein
LVDFFFRLIDFQDILVSLRVRAAIVVPRTELRRFRDCVSDLESDERQASIPAATRARPRRLPA